MKKGKVIWALLLIGIAVLILAGGLGVIPEVSGKLIAAVLLGVVAVGRRCSQSSVQDLGSGG